MATDPPEPARAPRPLCDSVGAMPNAGLDSDFVRAGGELPRSRNSGGLLPGIDPLSNGSLLDAADDAERKV